MSRLSPVSWRELVRRLRVLGFEGGKHPYMVKEELVLTIPDPHRQAIGIELLQRILQRANISRNEWLKAK